MPKRGRQAATAAPTTVARLRPDQLRTASDRELAVCAQHGDREAFGQLVERHQRAVYGYVRARLVKADDAGDLTQEVFVRAYTGRARFDTSSMVLPWLLGIARNVLREYIRAARRRRQVEAAWTEICLELDDAAESGPAGQRLGEDQVSWTQAMAVHLPGCLEQLGPSARQAIDLRYSGRLRLAEIGARLKRSEGAAKLLMFRARQALRRCLEQRVRASNDE
jgi:RNA polymerase sigma-70 factor (ECF subfamily)